MGTTILDIARIAGVSRTTVSNVMNGNGKCRPETLDRVLRVAEELGYRPNFAARSLVNRRSNTLGLILPSWADRHFLSKSPFFSLTIEAINGSLRDQGTYDLLINCVNPAKAPGEVVDWALQRNLAGLVFVGDFEAAPLGPLEAEGIPMAFIDNYSAVRPSGIFFDTDNAEGARLAAAHLAGTGCRKLVCVSSNTAGSPVNGARWAGFRDALSSRGLTGRLIDSPGVSFDDGLALAPRLAAEDCDGVFAVGDALALGLVKGLLAHGRRVPGDVKVVGFDNLDAAVQARPELTSVDQAIYDKGRLAIEALTAAIAGGPRSFVVQLPVRLEARESTAPPPV